MKYSFKNRHNRHKLLLTTFHTLMYVLFILIFLGCSKSNDSSSNNSNGGDLSSENNGKLRQIKCAKERNSPFFYTLFFDYDQNGRLISYGVLGGEKTVWTRNSNGKIIKEVFTGGGNSNYTSTTNYYMKPDNLNQYLYFINTKTNTPPSRDSGVFVYSNNKIIQSGILKFTYDSKGSLSATVGREEYTWDNNPASISLVDEVLPFGRYHSKNNILIEKSLPNASASYSYTYNSHGRPASAVVTRTFTSSPKVIEYFEYLYDK